MKKKAQTKELGLNKKTKNSLITLKLMGKAVGDLSPRLQVCFGSEQHELCAFLCLYIEIIVYFVFFYVPNY